jgi:hypothetical protein
MLLLQASRYAADELRLPTGHMPPVSLLHYPLSMRPAVGAIRMRQAYSTTRISTQAGTIRPLTNAGGWSIMHSYVSDLS